MSSIQDGSANGKRSIGPYARAAETYLADGLSPIPVGRDKMPLVAGFHGRNGGWVTEKTAKTWLKPFGDANVAIRLPKDIICLDVDDYEGHDGGRTLRMLSDLLGKLPETMRSSARLSDGLSGIRWFRLPERYREMDWPGVAGPGIDIITWFERYVIAPPSLHKNGHYYEWLDERTDKLVPGSELVLGSLPMLPDSWCDHLAHSSGTRAARVQVADWKGWLDEHTHGKVCGLMKDTQQHWTQLVSEAESVGGVHDHARDGIKAILGDCSAGHTGAWSALVRLHREFVESATTRGRRREANARGEWTRMLSGAVEIAAAAWSGADDPCAELANMDNIRPIRSGTIQWLSDVDEERIKWLWQKYLPLGCMVMLDGESGHGKTLVLYDIAARASRGLEMPDGSQSMSDPVNVLVLAPEETVNSIIVPRLRAAGADLSRIAMPKIKTVGKNIVQEMLLLPDSAKRIANMVREADARLMIIDPITSFLSPAINTGNDASVRFALAPLAAELSKTECCAPMVRHFNKDSSKDAKYRGGGSVAFGALARVNLIAARLPIGSNNQGEFCIAQVSTNLTKTVNGALSYSIVDSKIKQDDDGNMVPRLEWCGSIDVDVNDLTKPSKPGPEAITMAEVVSVLRELFDRKDTWDANDVMKELDKAGVSVNKITVGKARKELGIMARQRFKPGGGIDAWVWTTRAKVKR